MRDMTHARIRNLAADHACSSVKRSKCPVHVAARVASGVARYPLPLGGGTANGRIALVGAESSITI